MHCICAPKKSSLALDKIVCVSKAEKKGVIAMYVHIYWD